MAITGPMISLPHHHDDAHGTPSLILEVCGGGESSEVGLITGIKASSLGGQGTGLWTPASFVLI